MELIDRQALKAYVNSLSTHPLNEWDTWGVLSAINKQPTIDAVEVVRCKECKHRPVGKSSGSEPDTHCPLWCGYCYNIGDEGDDFFCKYGERKQE